MKLSFYIIFFIAIFSISCSQQEIVISEQDIPEDVFYLEDQIKPFTGKCIIYYDGTENVKEILSFKKGILNGDGISYYANGLVKRQGAFQNGKLHGTWFGWDKKGNKTWEVNYENDSLNGSSIAWHTNGQIKTKGEYRANKRNSKWESFDLEGKLLEN